MVIEPRLDNFERLCTTGPSNMQFPLSVGEMSSLKTETALLVSTYITCFLFIREQSMPFLSSLGRDKGTLQRAIAGTSIVSLPILSKQSKKHFCTYITWAFRVRVNTGSESSSEQFWRKMHLSMATGLPAVNDVEPFSAGTGWLASYFAFFFLFLFRC